MESTTLLEAAEEAASVNDPAEGSALFDLVSGEPSTAEKAGPAQGLQLAIRAALLSLVFAALYGAAVGSTQPGLALTNLVKLPVVVITSVGCSLPLGWLAHRYAGRGWSASHLVMSVVVGVLTTTLVLACAAPLLALYYHTTEFVGAPLAMFTVAVALGLGTLNAFRAALKRQGQASLPAVLLPLSATGGVLLLALVQIVDLVSPILPEDTPFDHGVEGLLGGAWW